MAKEKTVKLPSGRRIEEDLLRRTIINAEGDSLDFMALKELEPHDLRFVFNVWLERELNNDDRIADATLSKQLR